jgi:alanine racemase
VSTLIRAVIDTAALRHNLMKLRERAQGARIAAVIKANAYGHGLVPVSRALKEADALAVARLEEGLALRAAGITQPIVLLEGVCNAQQLAEATQHDFELIVHDREQIELLEKVSRPLILWLKIDTGMNRLGLRSGELPAALERIRRLPAPPRALRLLTHLACADERSGEMTRRQLALFSEATRGLAYPVSIASSAALLGEVPVGGDWARPGIALYGVSPFPDCCGADLGLVPVMTLETQLIAVRRVPRGETVGYGATWRAGRDSVIAIAAAGYGDGLPRGLSGETAVLVNGQRAHVAGRLSMDMTALDVTGLPGVAIGARVVLWGRELPVEEIARHAGTIPYELLCRVSQRVPLTVR